MTTSQIIDMLYQAMWTAALVGGPIIIASLLVGLVISVLQAATQINEATLTFVPKIVVTALILIIGGQWMLGQLLTFTRAIFTMAEQVTK